MRPINTKDRIETLKRYMSEDGTFVEESQKQDVLTKQERESIERYQKTVDILKSKSAFCDEMSQSFNDMILVLIESCPEGKEQEQAISLIKQASDVTFGAILRYWNEEYSDRFNTRGK